MSSSNSGFENFLTAMQGAQDRHAMGPGGLVAVSFKTGLGLGFLGCGSFNQSYLFPCYASIANTLQAPIYMNAVQNRAV